MGPFAVVENPWPKYFLARDRYRGEGRFLKRPPKQPAWLQERLYRSMTRAGYRGVRGKCQFLIEEIVIFRFPKK
jgi:hypothetical protein